MQIHNYTKSDQGWFFFTILFIIIDYGRPQDIFPIVGTIRPALIVALILIYYILKEGDFYRYSCGQIRYISYFILLLSMYIPFAQNNYYAWLTTKTLLLYLPFVLSVIATVTNITRLKRIIFVLICLMVYVSGYSILHKGVGSGNYFADENDLSLYINMYLPFCYFFFFYAKKMKMKIFYMAAFILGLSSIVISFSRGGFVGLLAISFVVWINSSKRFVSLCLLLMIAFSFLYFVSDDYLREMSTISNTRESTASARLESWKAAWRMFHDYPFGVGGGNFMVRFPEYQGDYFSRGMWGRAAHSIWFTLIPESGILGIYLYFALLYKNIKDLLFLKNLKSKNDRDIQYLNSFSVCVIAALFGYFASGTFLSVLYYAHYWYLISFLVAAINITRKMQIVSE